MNDKVLPEIGSRVFRNIFVVKLPLVGIETEDNTNIDLVMMDWTNIQDGVYRYIAYFDDNTLVVKMIIMGYLYGEVVFQEYNSQNEVTGE